MICVDVEIAFGPDYLEFGCDRFEDEVCFYLGPVMVCFVKRKVKASWIKPEFRKYVPQGDERRYYGWAMCSINWLGNYIEMSMPVR